MGADTCHLFTDSGQACKQKVSIRMHVTLALVVLVAAYSIGYGPVTSVVLSELFPTTLRGRAMSLAVMVYSIRNNNYSVGNQHNWPLITYPIRHVKTHIQSFVFHIDISQH